MILKKETTSEKVAPPCGTRLRLALYGMTNSSELSPFPILSPFNKQQQFEESHLLLNHDHMYRHSSLIDSHHNLSPHNRAEILYPHTLIEVGSIVRRVKAPTVCLLPAGSIDHFTLNESVALPWSIDGIKLESIRFHKFPLASGLAENSRRNSHSSLILEMGSDR